MFSSVLVITLVQLAHPELTTLYRCVLQVYKYICQVSTLPGDYLPTPGSFLTWKKEKWAELKTLIVMITEKRERRRGGEEGEGEGVG